MGHPVCAKCGSQSVYLDMELLGERSIACLKCGNRWPGAGKGFYMKGKDAVKDQLKPSGIAKKICKKCGERETLSKNCPYCAKCMGDIARAKKEAKKPPGTGALKVMGEQPAQLGKGSPGASSAVTIDFNNYRDLLDSIRVLAVEEVRPVDLQIIYLLKGRVNEIKRTAQTL
jgi:hypothetical protein